MTKNVKTAIAVIATLGVPSAFSIGLYLLDSRYMPREALAQHDQKEHDPQEVEYIVKMEAVDLALQKLQKTQDVKFESIELALAELICRSNDGTFKFGKCNLP